MKGKDSMEHNDFDADSEDKDASVDSVANQINQQSKADLLINAEILLPQDEEVQMATILCRSINTDGNVMGTFDENPNLNTLIYDDEFPDG